MKALIVSILFASIGLTQAIIPCPIFEDGYCAIDIANPCLGERKNEPRIVLIDRTGKVVMEDIPDWSVGQNMAHLIDPKKQDPSTPPEQDKDDANREQAGVFGVGKKRGLRFWPSKRVITPPKWDEVKWNGDCARATVRKGQLWQLLDDEGKELTDLRWKTIRVAHENPEHSLVQDEKGWGVINAITGELVLPPQFQEIKTFHEGHAVATKKDGMSVLIDGMGNESAALPGEFLTQHYQTGEILCLSSEGVALLVNHAGKKIATLPEFSRKVYESLDWPIASEGDLIPYPKESGWGAITSSGSTAVPFQYDNLGSDGQGGLLANEGVIQVRAGGKFGFVTEKGKVVSTPRWDTAGFFSGGLAYVSAGDRWGFVDKSGKVVIGPFPMGESAE